MNVWDDAAEPLLRVLRFRAFAHTKLTYPHRTVAGCAVTCARRLVWPFCVLGELYHIGYTRLFTTISRQFSSITCHSDS